MKEYVETKKVISNGLINFANNKKYVRLIPTNKGIEIQLTNAVCKGRGILLRLTSEGKIRIPFDWLDVYALFGEIKFRKYNNNKAMIYSPVKESNVPKALIGYEDKCHKQLKIDKWQKVGIVNLTQNDTYYHKLIKKMGINCFEFHVGELPYIRGFCSYEAYPTSRELSRTFGQNLQNFAGEVMTFKKNSLNGQTPACKQFIQAKQADLYVKGNEILVIPIVQDDITKEPIDIAHNDAVKEVFVSKKAKNEIDNGEAKKLVNLVKQVTSLSEELKYYLSLVEAPQHV